MISEFVNCDMCDVKIKKEDKDKWHNLNIVRHLKPTAHINKKPVDRNMNASFHICTNDLKDLLFEVLGVNLNDEHSLMLHTKIAEKLRLYP